MLKIIASIILCASLATSAAFAAPTKGKKAKASAEAEACKEDLHKKAMARERGEVYMALRSVFAPMLKTIPEAEGKLSDSDIEAVLKKELKSRVAYQFKHTQHLWPESTSDAAHDTLDSFWETLQQNSTVDPHINLHEPFMRDFTGQFAGFVALLPKSDKAFNWETIDKFEESGVLYTNYSNVGAYGNRLNLSLAFTSAILQDIVLDLYKDPVSLDEKQRALLTMFTSRGYMEEDGDIVRSILLEGMASTTQAVSFLTSDAIEGYSYDDRVRLIHDIVIGKSAEAPSPLMDITRRLPMGVLAPVSFLGKYFPGAVTPEMTTNPRLADIMRTVRGMQHARMATQRDQYAIATQGTGMGCPVAGDLCPLFASYFRIFTIVDAYLTANPIKITMAR